MSSQRTFLGLSIFTSLNKTVTSLSLTGKLILGILVSVFAFSSLFMLYEVNAAFLVAVPKHGGSITEGVIGQPRFINPLLAVTDADEDLAALVYSGLMRRDASGAVVPDLAESYTLSEDGKVYTFSIRPNAVFHDGTKVTADDIVFTIHLAQNSSIKSVHYADWAGVTVQKIDDSHISFTLRESYAPFIENTTIGILPKHIWESSATDTAFPLAIYNLNPIGSGPFEIGSIKKNKEGIASEYNLKPFENYTLGVPFLSKITLKFYTSEENLLEAFNRGSIDTLFGISPNEGYMLKNDGASLKEQALPRVFGVFFNQTANPVLEDDTVRAALDMSVNRDYIVNTVLQGFADSLTTPVPLAFTGIKKIATSSDTNSIEAANALLEENGWILNANNIREKKFKSGTTTLSFSISTSDAPELKEVASILKEEWARIGADVSFKIVEGGYLNQNIIRPRNYEALLFGQVVNRDLDLYPFWHSSQTQDPGLNISLYSNSEVDKLLQEMRSTSDLSVKLSDYQKFQTQIDKDKPAVFLYSPHLISAIPANIQNLKIGPLNTPSERFSNVYEWYTETDKIWSAFLK